MVSGIMALAAVTETFAGLGQLADMVLDGMGTTATRIVFTSGAGPVAVCSREAGLDRWIAVAQVTAAADIDHSIDVERGSIEGQIVRIHMGVTVAAPGGCMAGLRRIAMTLSAVS